jgi:hypothetical protein
VGAGCHWLTPVTLATWEAEIRRITVPGHPGQKKKFTRLHLNGKKLGVIPATVGVWYRVLWAKSKTLSQNKSEQKGLEEECLPSKHKPLSSNPSAAKTK